MLDPTETTSEIRSRHHIDEGRFRLSELTRIVTMDAPTAQFAEVPEDVHDFVAFNGLSDDGIGAGTWRASAREWAAIALLQALDVDLKAADGSEITVSLSEIAPFLKKDAEPTDFPDQQKAADLADRIVGFNTMNLKELAEETRAILIGEQNPIVELRKMTGRDWEAIDARKKEFYPGITIEF